MLKLNVNAFESISGLYLEFRAILQLAWQSSWKDYQALKKNDVECDYQFLSSGMWDNHVDINDNTLLVSPFFTANKNRLTAKSLARYRYSAV